MVVRSVCDGGLRLSVSVIIQMNDLGPTRQAGGLGFLAVGHHVHGQTVAASRSGDGEQYRDQNLSQDPMHARHKIRKTHTSQPGADAVASISPCTVFQKDRIDRTLARNAIKLPSAAARLIARPEGELHASWTHDAHYLVTRYRLWSAPKTQLRLSTQHGFRVLPGVLLLGGQLRGNRSPLWQYVRRGMLWQ